MSTLPAPRIYDRELNAAITTLTNKFLPRGYETRSPLNTMDPEELWKSCEDGRPLVFSRDGYVSSSIFGDAEVETQFQAITQYFSFTPPAAHANHRPTICAAMVIAGFDRLADEIVNQYGDDERTQRWRKAIWVHTIGRLAFNALVGNVAGNREDHYDFVVKTLEHIDPENKETVQEIRDGLVGMYVQAEQQREAIMGMIRAAASAAKAKNDDETAQQAGVTFH